MRGTPGGATAPIAPTNFGSGELIATSRSIVWRDGPEIVDAPLAGTTTPRVLATPPEPTGFAADTSHLYVRGADGLTAIDLDTLEARLITVDRSAEAVAIDGDALIVTRCASVLGGAGLWRIAIADGQIEELAAGVCATTIELDDRYISTLDRLDDTSPVGVIRTPRGGGPPVFLVESDGLLLAVRDGFVYTTSRGQVLRAAVSGAGVTVVREFEAIGIAVDDTTVYWTERAGTQTVLASMPLPP